MTKTAKTKELMYLDLGKRQSNITFKKDMFTFDFGYQEFI